MNAQKENHDTTNGNNQSNLSSLHSLWGRSSTHCPLVCLEDRKGLGRGMKKKQKLEQENRMMNWKLEFYESMNSPKIQALRKIHAQNLAYFKAGRYDLIKMPIETDL